MENTEEKLYYHVIAEHGQSEHYWYNMSKDVLIRRVIIPFAGGQVVLATNGQMKSIVNFKAVEELLIYETPFKLDTDFEGSPKWDMIFDHPNHLEFDCAERIFKDASEFVKKSGTSLFQKKYVPHKEQVFVIMQFGDKLLDSAYEGVVKDVFAEKDMAVVRADEIQDSGKISDQILENIAASKIVLADLSGSRPNCYYETGFAHAIGKEIILTIKKGEDIHFDLADHRFIFWETESDLRKQLKKRLNAVLQVGEESNKEKSKREKED